MTQEAYGKERAHKLRSEVERTRKNAGVGIEISVNIRFAMNGGVRDIDYFIHKRS